MGKGPQRQSTIAYPLEKNVKWVCGRCYEQTWLAASRFTNIVCDVVDLIEVV